MSTTPIAKIKNHRIFKRKETVGGILIIVFAILLAITELIANNLREQMLISQNQEVNYSNWYQAKSIKQNLKENQLDLLQALLQAGLIPKEEQQNFKNVIAHTKSMVIKYDAEKTELLLGSANIPTKYWAQDLDGKMGKIIGVKEWGEKTLLYDGASQKMSMGKLLFQISIVLCVVCVIIRDNESLRTNFIVLSLLFGLTGILSASYGLMQILWEV
ncbi:MAG: DUF4337 family protein [Arenibacter sp.]|nr:DUF4337 family protein [Arenibacter sp.]